MTVVFTQVYPTCKVVSPVGECVSREHAGPFSVSLCNFAIIGISSLSHCNMSVSLVQCDDVST